MSRTVAPSRDSATARCQRQVVLTSTRSGPPAKALSRDEQFSSDAATPQKSKAKPITEAARRSRAKHGDAHREDARGHGTLRAGQDRARGVEAALGLGVHVGRQRALAHDVDVV